MCGRFVVDASLEMLVQWFAAMTDLTSWTPSWNVAPSHSVPILLGGARGRRLGLMRWGWKRDSLLHRLAQAEEAHARKTFAAAMNTRRCLIPASAFYEWPEVGEKQPYAFRMHTSEPFAIGGLWEQQPDQPLATFVLMTIAANADISFLQDRMPFIIPRENWDHWLNPAMTTTDVEPLIVPPSAGLLKSYMVSKRVNKVPTKKAPNDDAGLIEPVER